MLSYVDSLRLNDDRINSIYGGGWGGGPYFRSGVKIFKAFNTYDY